MEIKAWHALLHSPNKEMHSWKLGQACSLHGSNYNVVSSPVYGFSPKCRMMSQWRN